MAKNSSTKSSPKNALATIGNFDLTKPVTDELLQICRLAKKVIDDIEKRAKAQIENNPESLPLHYLQPGAEKRTITSNTEVIRKMRNLVNPMSGDVFPVSALLDCASFSLPQLEKTIKVFMDCTEDQAKKIIMEHLGDTIKISHNSPSLKSI